MKRSLSALAVAATLAFGFGFAGTTGSASATGAAGAVRTTAPIEAAPSLVEQVNNHRGRHYRGNREWRQWHHNRRHADRRWHRPPPYYGPRSGIYFEFNAGPRRYAPPPRRNYYRMSQAHVNWCYSRYRSYRASDNSFQPYGGPRRQCRSPYS